MLGRSQSGGGALPNDALQLTALEGWRVLWQSAELT